MTPDTNASSDFSKIEQDFLEALMRLQTGQPQTSRLKDLLRRGKLKIGFGTVAEEAGHSPTLIRQQNSRYPNVRAKILRAKTIPGRHRTSDDVIADLRLVNAELKRQVEQLISKNAALVGRMFDVEQAMELEKKRFGVLQASRMSNPNQMVGLLKEQVTDTPKNLTFTSAELPEQ